MVGVTAILTCAYWSRNSGLALGGLLIKAKATVPHGQWLPWLRQNITFSERTAQGYMRIAQRSSRLQIRNGVADLSVRGALKELATTRHHAMMDDFAAWTERGRSLSDPDCEARFYIRMY